MNICRRDVINIQEKNVKFLLADFCYSFSLSSKLVGAKDVTAGQIIWPFYTVLPFLFGFVFSSSFQTPQEPGFINSKPTEVFALTSFLSCTGLEALSTGSEFLLSNAVFC